MDKELRILILEDVPADAELMERELRKGGIVFVSKSVETKEAYIKELKDFNPDLILSDYSLPMFDGLSALLIAKEQCPEVPFILVSGAIGEELAAEILKSGATDYVLKSRLSRLVPAVKRALRDVEELAERKRAEAALRDSEEKYRDLVDNGLVGIYKTNLNGDILYVNEALWRMLEFESSEEMMAESVLKRYKNLKDREVLLGKLKEKSKAKEFEVELLTKTGKIKNVFLSAVTDGNFISGMIVDVTERKKSEERINQLFDVLTKAKKEWEMTFDNVMELVMLVDENLRIIRCNKSFAKFAGMSIREIAGRKCYEFFSCNYEQIGLCRVYMQTGEILPKTEINTRDGCWFYISHCPVTDEKGKFHFSVVVATDITDIKNSQQKLMEYQEELKKRIKELEDFYEMGIGRELRMIELKKEIEDLKEELSRYKKE